MLPAKQQINLFTTEKNVDKETIIAIENLIKEAKKISITNISDFDADIKQSVHQIDLDTFMYLISLYSFEKPVLTSSYDNEIYFTSRREVPIKTKERFAEIRLYSKHTKIELLPNDIKQVLNI